MKNPRGKILWIFIIGAVVSGIAAWAYYQNQPGSYDQLAECLQGKGVVFYGTFWCPICQSQKVAFGRSAKNLPYVECSLPSGRGQTQVCIEEGIQSYPTWEFQDGSRITGEFTPAELAEKAGCEVSQ
ncbi:MAG: hypothetical protein Q8Q38_02060 [bacterium]|nr:hypothetical protein [bacterium]